MAAVYGSCTVMFGQQLITSCSFGATRVMAPVPPNHNPLAVENILWQRSPQPSLACTLCPLVLCSSTC
jgi:hypothetical protein